MASASSLAGCRTRTCRAAARDLTALGTTRSPRPDGRSGWVSTSATVCVLPRIRPSERSANSGVPAKIRRRNGEALRGLAQLLGELRADALLLELRQVLDEDLALEVIHLVLDAHREQPLRLEGESDAVLVVRPHAHALG